MQIEDIKVIKRDGRKRKYNIDKIEKALKNVYIDYFGDITDNHKKNIKKYSKEVEQKIIEFNKKNISVEDIQDIVENVLIKNNEADLAKKYILYRSKRTQIRESNGLLMQLYKDITFKDSSELNLKRDNANVNGNTAMGTMLQYGTIGSKEFGLSHIVNKKYAKAHRNCDIHIHDLDFLPTGTTTCTQIDIIKLFKNGFSTGHGYLREPNDISSYMALAAIAIQSNQNDQHGGQSIPNFDYGMAQGILKSFKKILKEKINDFYSTISLIKKNVDINCSNLDNFINEINSININDNDIVYMSELLKIGIVCDDNDFDYLDIMKGIYDRTIKKLDRKTYQASEGLIHNLNTMHSRAGAQVPFSSINFGTDTTPEGRMVIKNILLAIEAGLGNGETAIFPISIFKVKEGINFNKEDPNYDLFKLACKVSAKRLFPNFVFIDAPHNLQYYKPGHPETEVATMGCRTRVIGSIFKESNGISWGRGNLSFTTINLPRLALRTHSIEEFYKELDKMIDLCVEQLYERFKLQINKKIKNFPFLLGQNNWLFSEKHKNDENLMEILKHGTLSVGFIGLAETLIQLTGKHHGESEESQKLGLEIISHMREKMDYYSKVKKLNYTLLATPAEGLSGRFVKSDKEIFGIVKGVTDKDYYTNSFHVPVYYNITAKNKIKIEAPYHELTNAGHISYIELDGDTTQNLEAFEDIIRYMKECGIGYGSINHPVDRCPVCGYNGIINNECPRCGRKDGEGVTLEKLLKLKEQYPNIKIPEID